MKIIVLGAGIIGVTTACALARNGHEVIVLEKNSKPALECSYANGGQLSYSHIEPWANSQLLARIPKLLFMKNSPLIFNPRFDLDMYKWIFKFLLCCSNKKSDYSTINMARLGLYSKKCLHDILNYKSIEFDYIKKGILHVFNSKEDLVEYTKVAKFKKKLGIDFEILDSLEKCIEKEPSIEYSPLLIECGMYFPLDETGDICKFTINLMEECKLDNVKFHFDTSVNQIIVDNGKFERIITDKGDFKADKIVVCMGANSLPVLKNINIDIPIYPLKGYSLSIDIEDSKKAPLISITDQKNKIVACKLGNILRVAGTAEFAGFNNKVDNKRIHTLKFMTKNLLPHAGNIDNAKTWACLRPSIPDGCPVIGKTQYKNLYLNTGHGTLGWSLACGSAYVIRDVIEGKNTEIDLTGLNYERFYGDIS